MGKNSSVSYEESIGAIEKYLRHEDSLKHLSKQLKASHGAIQ